ncbi:MAG: pyruvate formate lyase family protein, partial [Lentisphaeria bacterium]
MTAPCSTPTATTREFAIFMAAGEPFAAGFFEQPNAPMASRHAAAICRYLEAAPPLAVAAGARLYPSGAGSVWRQLPDACVTFEYSYSLGLRDGLAEKLLPHCADDFERQLAQRAVGELRHWCANAIPGRFCIGGGGYTHSILNYGRLLREGLTGYRARLQAALARHAGDDSRTRLLQAMAEALDAIMAYHGKCVRQVNQARDAAAGDDRQRLAALAEALGKVPLHPAGSFYEALVAFNFLWNLDGCDSVGRFDQDLSAYFDADVKAGRLDEATAAALLSELWANFDANDGWHLLLGGTDTVSPRFTRLCVTTMAPFRRPNAGIRVVDNMPDDLWEAIFDGWQAGGVNPALYNEAAYATGIATLPGIPPDQRHQFACGGCTELMFHGASNVGSIDAGVNLLEIFERSLRAHWKASASYEAFLACFKRDAASEIDAAIDAANLNQQYMAQFRPQLIRSLFIDDCIGRGVEYNAGGAMVNGAVINVAGLTNVINSLDVLKRVCNRQLPIPKSAVLPMLAANFAGYETAHAHIAALKKFGNAGADTDAIAHDLSSLVFEKIRARRSWRGTGFCVPGV